MMFSVLKRSPDSPLTISNAAVQTLLLTVIDRAEPISVSSTARVGEWYTSILSVIKVVHRHAVVTGSRDCLHHTYID